MLSKFSTRDHNIAFPLRPFYCRVHVPLVPRRSDATGHKQFSWLTHLFFVTSACGETGINYTMNLVLAEQLEKAALNPHWFVSIKMELGIDENAILNCFGFQVSQLYLYPRRKLFFTSLPFPNVIIEISPSQ